MWKKWLIALQLLALEQQLYSQEDLDPPFVSPQNCSLKCLQQKAELEHKYCRITRDDVERTLGFRSTKAFGSCLPWPCFQLFGKEEPKLCQHYAQAPDDVTVKFLDDHNSQSDSIIVTWRPSYYGIAFLRGFQVSLQALGGGNVGCQLFIFHRNISLSASHAQMVYTSDPFRGLSLGSQYAVTVMALPVPEVWDRFYHSKIFSTRSCAAKNGVHQCRNDWYPKHVEVKQQGNVINVTFNLAPPNLGIRGYFSKCYGLNGEKKFNDIRPNLDQNKTYHSYQILDLHEGINYTCEIAANEVDAVRKTFHIVWKMDHGKDSTTTPALAQLLPFCLLGVAIIIILMAVLTWRRPKLWKMDIGPDFIEQQLEGTTPEEVMTFSGRQTPPRLLICYSSYDGPAHVRAVLQFGAFIQEHMATQVCLDLWDSLGVAEEGSIAWYCREIRESDFVMVICSKGLSHRSLSLPLPEEEVALCCGSVDFSSVAAIHIVGAEVGRARALGQDLSKYMTATFEYSKETDIPTELKLVTHYTLTRDLPLLFSHLHKVSLHRPGGYLKISHITEDGFQNLPTGVALQSAIRDVAVAMKNRHHLVEGEH